VITLADGVLRLAGRSEIAQAPHLTGLGSGGL
jgi:hypothetical protein